MKDFLKKHCKLIIFLLMVAGVFVLNKHFGWSDNFDGTNSMHFLSDMVEENIVLASLVYIALTIICCVVLALPGVTFAIISGLIFGPWLGTFLCLTATTLGAIGAFIAGRYFLKDSIKPVLEKNRVLKKLLFDESDKSSVVILMITRLLPIFPYNLQNFAYGITDISFSTYSFYTFIFMIPGVSVYTIGAAGITDEANRWLYFGIAAVLLVLVLIITFIIKKRYMQNED